MRRKSSTLLLLAALLPAAGLLAEGAKPRPGADWPSFRGPRAAGVADGFATPAEFSVPEGKNILWKKDLPGLGHSSPIVWGDRVYVTTAIAASGAQQDLRVGLYGDIASVPGDEEMKWDLLALDKKTGALLWQKTLFQGKPAVQPPHQGHPRQLHRRHRRRTHRGDARLGRPARPRSWRASCCGKRISASSSRPTTRCPKRSGASPARRFSTTAS